MEVSEHGPEVTLTPQWLEDLLDGFVGNDPSVRIVDVAQCEVGGQRGARVTSLSLVDGIAQANLRWFVAGLDGGVIELLGTIPVAYLPAAMEPLESLVAALMWEESR